MVHPVTCYELFEKRCPFPTQGRPLVINSDVVVPCLSQPTVHWASIWRFRRLFLIFPICMRLLWLFPVMIDGSPFCIDLRFLAASLTEHRFPVLTNISPL